MRDLLTQYQATPTVQIAKKIRAAYHAADGDKSIWAGCTKGQYKLAFVAIDHAIDND